MAPLDAPLRLRKLDPDEVDRYFPDRRRTTDWLDVLREIQAGLRGAHPRPGQIVAVVPAQRMGQARLQMLVRAALDALGFGGRAEWKPLPNGGLYVRIPERMEAAHAHRRSGSTGPPG